VIRNLEWLRSLPQIGAKLREIVDDLNMQHGNVEQQVNGNGQGQPVAPPAIGGLKVTAQNGHFRFSITDNSPLYRGVSYFVEHADNPHFTNSETVHLGASREHRLFLGNSTIYARAYSSYPTSGPGTPAYFGSQVQPRAISGGGSVGAGPAYGESQGSGTGAAGAGLQGPGVAPFRSTDGAPPKR
jgi:hypothetical protein